MKRLVTIAAFAALLSGCGIDSYVSVYTDTNGCQYLITSVRAMTPRMGPDGHQVCSTGKEGGACRSSPPTSA